MTDWITEEREHLVQRLKQASTAAGERVYGEMSDPLSFTVHNVSLELPQICVYFSQEQYQSNSTSSTWGVVGEITIDCWSYVPPSPHLGKDRATGAKHRDDLIDAALAATVRSYSWVHRWERVPTFSVKRGLTTAGDLPIWVGQIIIQVETHVEMDDYQTDLDNWETVQNQQSNQKDNLGVPVDIIYDLEQ